jgi:hypothetical protein
MPERKARYARRVDPFVRLSFGCGALALTLSACTLGLDWNPSAHRADANAMEVDVVQEDLPPAPNDQEDLPPAPNDAAPDRAVFDLPTMAIDTGPGVDTGPTSPGNCGDRDERCCAWGWCSPGNVCQPSRNMHLCVQCGGDGQRCCAFGGCSNNHFCTLRPGDATPLCRACGGHNEQCCSNRWCRDNRQCLYRPGSPYPTCQ